MTTARAQLSWTAFEQLHHDAVRLAYEVWPSSDDESGQGLSVVAIEGSQSRRPACDALRTAFDPDRGLDPPGNGHDPPCLGSTVDEVFRRLPIARTVHPMADANERQEATARLPPMPSGGSWLFARGYPSDAFLDSRLGHYPGYWGRRGPAAAAVPPVEAVVQSGQTEAMLPRTPPRPNCSRDAPVA